jgi:hypothetical protein
MTEQERLLILLDGLREQIAAGTHFAYLFAWASPPVPLEPAPGRMPEAAGVPFTAPQPGAVVHLLLSWGADGDAVLKAHVRLAEPFAAEVARG